MICTVPGCETLDLHIHIDDRNQSYYDVGGVNTLDFIRAKLTPDEYRGFLKGNLIKYVSRASFKGHEKEDYKKALWYSEKLTNVL
jgi:hypothetical protein